MCTVRVTMAENGANFSKKCSFWRRSLDLRRDLLGSSTHVGLARLTLCRKLEIFSHVCVVPESLSGAFEKLSVCNAIHFFGFYFRVPSLLSVCFVNSWFCTTVMVAVVLQFIFTVAGEQPEDFGLRCWYCRSLGKVLSPTSNHEVNWTFTPLCVTDSIHGSTFQTRINEVLSFIKTRGFEMYV